MCFSISAQLDKQKIEQSTGAKFPKGVEFSPFYFKSAFQNPWVAVITSAQNNLIALMEWGIIPHWVSTWEQATEIRAKTYNARVENIFNKPSFKYYSQVNRCVIPVSGFFEWQKVDNRKIPWYIYPKNSNIFNLAGIWNEWTNPISGEIHSTFSIITLPANRFMSKIHNTQKRMPAILADKAVSKWLKQNLEISEYAELLVPMCDREMQAHTVSPLISNKNENRNVHQVIEPYAYNLNQQQTLF